MSERDSGARSIVRKCREVRPADTNAIGDDNGRAVAPCDVPTQSTALTSGGMGTRGSDEHKEDK